MSSTTYQQSVSEYGLQMQSETVLAGRVKQKGFTFIELMIILALAGIMAALAGPSFIDAIRRNQLLSQANNLGAAMNYARVSAVNSAQTVTIASNNGTTWNQGWDVYVDTSVAPPGAWDNQPATLLRRETGDSNPNPRFTVTQTSVTANGGFVTFDPKGRLVSAAQETIDVCDVEQDLQGRQIAVNVVGRVTVRSTPGICAGSADRTYGER